MSFADWRYLLLPFIWLPLLIIYFYIAGRKRDFFVNKFSKWQQKEILFCSVKRIWMKRFILIIAFSLLTVAAARPQTITKELHFESEGMDIAVVFDTSLSMLAEDAEGSRMELGKNQLMDMVSSLNGDRIALVPFAGDAFLQLPLTSDYNTALSLISILEPGMINKNGTAITEAIELATETLSTSSENSDRLLVIISDGEDPSLDFDKIKELQQKNHIHFAFLPVGSVEGAPVSVNGSYLKDKQGNMVITKMNKDFFEKCKTVLSADEIKKGETFSQYVAKFKNRVKTGESQIPVYVEMFQLPLFMGIIMFFLFFAIASTGRKGAER